MKTPENTNSESDESLKELLKKRHDLDRKLEDQYTKLYAVMFTDIKGSTEYYDLRGDINGRVQFEQHNRIINPVIAEYKGKTIKSTGDGLMIVFDEPLNSVKAAIEIQNKLWALNKGKRKQDKLHVRISINYGKVIEDEEDVYGLEVSISSRINSVTNPDHILISESLYEEIKDINEIICRPLPPVKVKGVQEALKLYQVIWGKEDTVNQYAQDAATAFDRGGAKRRIFNLNVIKETGKIKISGYEKIEGEKKTIRHYEEVKVDEERTKQYKAEIISLLNRANQKGHVSRDILNKLKATGQLLYDSLFSIEIKRKLDVTEAEDLIISLDDNLVDIPWELLYDGKSFLCIKFNIGRLVSTRQSISEALPRKMSFPLKMLVLSNPLGNLKSAYMEGFSIRDKLEHLNNTVHINVRSNGITSTFVKENIRNFDVVHYSGHADYNSNNPSESGFLLEDGKLKASDIMSLIGSSPLPSLVFSNACKSGHTDKWSVEEHYGQEIYGLANAFLLAGVNHYIGTFWDVQDEAGLYFAISFYSELMRGAMIGEAVRKARLELIRKYGEDTMIWASYMLYGDPTYRYVEINKSETVNPDKQIYQETQEEPAAALSGNIRSIAETAALPQKNRSRILMGSGLILILSIMVVFYMLQQKKSVSVQQMPVTVTEISKEAKAKRIDELATSLIRAYEEKQKNGQGKPEAIQMNVQPTMVFMNMKTYGVNDMEVEYILSRVTTTLQDTKKVQVVERELLDKLLEELKLSSSQLADPATALKVGRILSARLISTGSIMKEDNSWQISMRLIETETTSIKAALTATIKTKEKDEVADKLSQEILNKLGIGPL